MDVEFCLVALEDRADPLTTELVARVTTAARYEPERCRDAETKVAIADE